MNKTDTLRRLNRVFSSEKIDFSAIDAEMDKLKKNLTETVNIQTVADVSRKIKQFQDKIDFGPLLNEIEKAFLKEIENIRGEFSGDVNDLETQLKDKNAQLIKASEEKNGVQITSLSEEIASLRESLTNIESSRQKNVDSLMGQIEERITEVQLLNKRFDSLALDLKTRSTKDEVLKIVKDTQTNIDELKKELLKKINAFGGGSINRQIFVGGLDALSKYSDVNLKAGAGTTITFANNNTTRKAEITITATGSGTGITRSVNTINGDTTAGNTAGVDYVYICTTTLILTLPTAVGNSNLYTVKNTGTGTVTITPAGVETIDGSANIIMPVQYTSVDLISDTLNWNVT